MKRKAPRFILCFFFLVPLSPVLSIAQDLTGIWRGYFTTDSYQQYKYELQIDQKGNAVSGVSYSYLTTIFYGKATLTGSFNNNGQSALIREIKTVELKMAGGSQACIMKCIFQYNKSGKEAFLEGSFTSKYEKNGFGVKKGDDCGGGTVFLRKVNTSDFYIEPFLRNNTKTKNPEIVNNPPLKKDSSTVRILKPSVRTNNPVVTRKPIVKPVPNKKDIVINNIPDKPAIDSIIKTEVPLPKVIIPKPIVNSPDVLKNRENELIKTLIVTDPDVIVKLYDNGEIDDDTISVYMDKKLVLSAKRLTASPLVIKLKMDEENTEHELVMVAENLGRIPPNTSLMIVESGEQRFDVRITSTEQKNAVVRFRYQKPK